MLNRLFARLFNKSEPDAQSSDAPPNALTKLDHAAEVGLQIRNNGPRPQHYRFANLDLPRFAHKNAETLLSLLSGDNRDRFLLDLWAEAGAELPASERIAPDGLTCEMRTHGDYPVALVTLPTPERVPEAYFVGIVFVREATEAEPDSDPNPLTCRYLTLEYGFNVEALEACTILGGWTPDGTHHNFGLGPPPDINAFYSRICDGLK